MDSSDPIEFHGNQGQDPLLDRPPSRSSRRTRGAPARRSLALGGLIALAFGVAYADPAYGQEDTPELDRRFPVAEQTADFIVVLDRSLSMRPYWPATAASLSAFVGALPEGDHVAFVTFDRGASNSLVIPRALTPASRASLLAEIERVPPPQRRATDDDWNYTDLGEALAKTLDEINRPEANALAFVFLLTDFVHEPHGTSRFSSRDLESPAWKVLVDRGGVLREGRALRSFALILPVDGRAGRDIGLARAVVGTMPEVRVDVGTLGPWFRRLAQEIRREKLAALVEADLSRGFEWSLRPQGGRTLLQLRSRLQRMPVTISIDRAMLGGRVASVLQRQDRFLGPGATLEFPLEVSACPEGFPWWRWLVATRKTGAAESQVDIEGGIGLDPANELVRIGVDPARPLGASITGPAALSTCGAPLWLQIFVVFGLLGISGGTWRTWLRPAPPVRAFARKVMLSGAGHSETLELPADGRRTIVLGNTADATVRSSLSSPGWALTLVSRKPRFPRSRPQRGLYAYRATGQVFYRGKEYDKAGRRWVDRDLPLPDAPPRAVRVGFQTKLVIHSAGGPVALTLHS